MTQFLNKTRETKIVITFAAMLVLAAGALCNVTSAQETPPAIPSQEQPEVLTRGPVHEAFAEPVNVQVQDGVVAPFAPPPNLNEAPPTESPQQGGHYVWVPGYWAWDADRNNYIWVSACWRAAPPNMSWVPGYWSQVADGWEWVAGFWTPIENKEIVYLPPPPAVEDVPPPAPPSPDYIWVPPCWYWNQTQYIQRSGYWLTAQPGWIWVPSHYIWTPRGYVFVGGHWDYTLEQRGVLFAPVYFPSPIYARPGFVYSPSIVIDIGALSISLFTYPRYCHYYFGDYYDDSYIRVGIYPWFEAERRHTWYDPIYEHRRWHYRRTEPRWEERQRHEYDIRRADVNLRPARTYREMETQVARLPEPQRRDVRIAQPLTTFVADKTNHLKFEHINAKTQRDIATQATAVRKFRDDRRGWESQGERVRIGQPPEERKGPVTPPGQHKENITTPPEHKGPVTPQIERREPVTPTPERKGPANQQGEHKENIATPPEHKGPATPQIERKEPATTPERKGPVVTPPPQRKEKEQEQAAQPKEPKFVPPRQVRITQPERVQVPEQPITGKPSAGEKGPPPRPENERKDRGDIKDTPNKGEVKGTPKGQGQQKKNRD